MNCLGRGLYLFCSLQAICGSARPKSAGRASTHKHILVGVLISPEFLNKVSLWGGRGEDTSEAMFLSSEPNRAPQEISSGDTVLGYTFTSVAGVAARSSLGYLTEHLSVVISSSETESLDRHSHRPQWADALSRDRHRGVPWPDSSLGQRWNWGPDRAWGLIKVIQLESLWSEPWVC